MGRVVEFASKQGGAMSETSGIVEHYASGKLHSRIEAALDDYGAKRPLDIDTLALFDEFHIGGRQATETLINALSINAGSRVLDMGCGLGGPARFVAKSTTARVTGIDLTQEFVETGNALTGQALMVDLVDLQHGSILDMPYEDDRFDVAYMIHVGMNIPDKARIAAEAARVLKPGGMFGIYDVMAMNGAELAYPLPWASEKSQSFLSTPRAYREALEQAGFTLKMETDETDMALEFFARQAEKQRLAIGPQILGLHLVMGPDFSTKIGNLVSALRDGHIAPVQITAQLGS